MSLAESTSDIAVETIYDILTGFPDTIEGYGASYGVNYGGLDSWANTQPEIYKLWGVEPKSRENNPDPALYLWSPTEGTLDAFSMDGDHMIQDNTVEVSCWTYNEASAVRYREDVINILSEYWNDNEENTEFHRVRPSGMSDHRNEKIARQTDHYISAVQVSTSKLRDTGV